MNGLTQDKALIFANTLPLRERLIWKLGTQTGLRISDILHLYKKDLLSGKWKTKERKTGKIKRCKIDTETINLVKAYLQFYPTPYKKKLFINIKTKKPFTRQAIYKNFKKIAKRLKYARIAPHSTRKTFAQNLLKMGYNVDYIQKQLNHAKQDTTQIYLKNKREKTTKQQKTK